MHINERNTAVRNAKALLEKRGVMVLAASTNKPRPVIEIAFPTVVMQSKAIEMTEQVKGCIRTIYLYPSRICGCIVRWRIYDDQQRVETLVQNMSDFAPELIAFCPKNL